MKRKTRYKIFIALLVAGLSFIFGGCAFVETESLTDSESTSSAEESYEGSFAMSDGLEMKFNQATNTYSVTGIGSCTDNALKISGAYEGKRVEKIEKDAFIDCKQFVSVEIDEGIVSIGANAFLNCTNLLQVTVGESVEKIDTYAFYNCTKLSQICNKSALSVVEQDKGNGHLGYYAKSVASDQTNFNEIFINEDGFVFQRVGEGYGLKGYVGAQADVTLPSVFNNDSYIVDEYCFYRSDIEILHIPADFTSFGENAFLNCAELKEIRYGGGVSQWGALQWQNAESNPLSNGTKLFTAEGAVEGNVTLDFPIQDYAFYNYSYLTGLTLGEECTTLGVSAFEKCSGLKTLTVGGALREITDSAFQGCEALETVVFSAGLEKIGEEAFYSAKKLSAIEFPDSVTEIEKKAFYRCESVKILHFPASMRTIGNESFAYCMGLTDLRLNDGLESIQFGAFAYCSSLEEATIPDSVTDLQESAFRTCDKLSFVSIGNGVSKIHIRTFYQCSLLETIILGTGVKEIEDYAFVAIYSSEQALYCYYRGTESEFASIRNYDRHLKSGWNGSAYYKANRTKLYYSATEPQTNQATYWHYVDGRPVAWS